MNDRENPAPKTRLKTADALPPGIIVMGPYRSATSFLSHVLSGRGVDFGPAHELYEADEWNPYGYFQRPDVLKANDDFLISAGHGVFDPTDLYTLRDRGNTEHLRDADLDWRYNTDIWGIKDPRFCVTLMSWFEAGLLGENVGLIRIKRELMDSAHSLLKHPELAAQLDEISLDAALKVIRSYDRLADEQERCFPGPVLSLNFAEVTHNPITCLDAIDGFIDAVMSSASSHDVEQAMY